jgi:predicted DNA-binding transcriptional regulator AlpA
MTPADRTLQLLGEALIQLANAPSALHTITVTETLTLSTTWNRARLYDVKPETRLTADDVAQIFGMTRAALYKRLKREAIPHRKCRDKSLSFLAGDLRRWYEAGEQVITPVIDYGAAVRRIK